ncbi:MAG: BMP family lipoprotein [Candidatus Thorarchaeota archaeon]
MNRNAILAIVVIAVIGVAGFGVYMIIQPVHNPNEIAIVFATGGLGDKSFNDGVYDGAVLANEHYNINFTYSEPTSVSDYESMIRGYAAHAGLIEGYDLIISVGFDQADAVMAVADDFPDQEFAIIDMYIDPVNYTNVASILFSENEGSALVGAIAGLTTQTGEIGFLGGMDIDLIRKFAAGYVWGANYTYFNYVNLGVNITHSEQYVGDWADIAAGKSLTSGMFTAGADIVFAAAGRSGLGAYDAAKEDNETSSVPLWVIGVDSPQMYLGCEDTENPVAPTVGLTSMLKRVDVAAYDIMYEAVIGTWTSGLKFYGLYNDGHDYEVNTDLLTLDQSIIDIVEMIKTGIINGTFVIPADVYW